MKERTMICISEKVMEKARKINLNIGVPVSRQFELAWVEKYDSE